MSLTPRQIEAAQKYISILTGIAKRLLREGKIKIENGKIVFLEETDDACSV